jgi:ATP-dependent 26S proteasome regulatory subunit
VHAAPSVNYDDVGGLEEELQRVREMTGCSSTLSSSNAWA